MAYHRNHRGFEVHLGDGADDACNCTLHWKANGAGRHEMKLAAWAIDCDSH
jgi:hypothetical protein